MGLDPERLPEQSAELILLGNLVRVLDRRLPGIVDEWAASIEDEAMRTEVVRLRGPRNSSTTMRVYAEAAAWAVHVRVLFRSVPQPPRTLWERMRGL